MAGIIITNCSDGRVKNNITFDKITMSNCTGIALESNIEKGRSESEDARWTPEKYRQTIADIIK